MQPVAMTATLSFIVRQAGEGSGSPSATMLKNIKYSIYQKILLKFRINILYLQSKRMTYENYNRKETDRLRRETS